MDQQKKATVIRKSRLQIFLFTSDMTLAEVMRPLLEKHSIEIVVQPHVLGSEAKSDLEHKAFLIHFTEDEDWPKAVLKELMMQIGSIGSKVMLVSEPNVHQKASAMTSKFQLAGCIPMRYVDGRIISIIAPLFKTHQLRRRHKRLRVNMPISYTFFGLEKPGECLSVSAGGLFVRTKLPPPKSSKVDVFMQLPNHAERITLTGSVVYDQNFGFAMRFDESKPELLNALS